MGIVSAIREKVALWFKPLDGAPLDILLSRADPGLRLEERTQWLCDWLEWLRRAPDKAEELGLDPARLTSARFRFFLQVVDRNPDQKVKVARMLRSILRDTSALDLFCEAGLPREHGFLREAAERISSRFLPEPPYTGELGALFNRLFPHRDDAARVARLEEATLQRFMELIEHSPATDEPAWNLLRTDMEEALVQLAAHIRIVGSSQPIRTRIGSRSFRELPFFHLTTATELVLKARKERPDEIPERELQKLGQALDTCQKAIESAYSHLEEYGVSTDIVYQLDRMRSQLMRMRVLLELLVARSLELGRVAEFMADLIREHQRRQGLRSLVRANLALLTRKMVERNATTGEHYIARDRQQYRAMFYQASGGGTVMALTTWLKFALAAIPLSMLMHGIVLGWNYALGFVVIQLCHFSLATKQPATTAPALAERMRDVRDPVALEKLIDEIVALIRSQAVAICGNILLIVPCSLFIAWVGNQAADQPLLGVEKAGNIVSSLSVLGMTPIFAAFTGVLLWFSSLAGGFADNWFAYHRMRSGLADSRRLRAVLGPARAANLSEWLDQNISGLTSNILLGMLLGMLPVLAEFMGLPIDVRHVTLGAGQLTAAIFTLGMTSLTSMAFWLATVGVACVGIINVAVSFALAMWVAIRAREVRAPERGAIYRALWRRFRVAPKSFFRP
ncbi:MAG TPA: hypothetical protein VK968_18645 [Roseimicrobium sp.]|nr:hypothetical protein [Roseimicrobium sp.]